VAAANSISSSSQVFNYNVRGFCQANNAVAYFPLTITVTHECASAACTKIATPANAFTYKLQDPSVAYDVSTGTNQLFTESAVPSGASCFEYLIYDTQATPAQVTTYPSYMSYSYPTVTLYTNSQKVINTLPSKTTNYNLRCRIKMTDGVSNFAPFSVTVTHECTGLSLTAGTAPTVSYTILSGAKTTSISSAFVQPPSTPNYCFKYTLQDYTTNTNSASFAIPLSLSYPNINVAATTAGTLSVAQQD